jgi:hypothetical protein
VDGVPPRRCPVLTIAVLLAFLATLTVADLLPSDRAALVVLPR